MKKLLTIILAVALILPAAALAEDWLDCDIGYCHTEVNKDGAPYFGFIFFTEKGVCYYCEKMFYADRPGQENAFIGTWEYDSDSDLSVYYRGNKLFTLHKLSEGNLINTETMMIYYRSLALFK